MPLAFYLDFATKQKGLRQAIDSKGLLSPNIVSLFCRPLPPSDNKGKDSAAIKQILHSYFIECTNLESPIKTFKVIHHYRTSQKNVTEKVKVKVAGNHYWVAEK